MATPSTTTALFQIIDEWIALVSPIAARDPAAFWANDFNAAGAVSRLRMFVTRFDDFTATNIINNELSGGTARLNRIFGTALSAPQFQSPVLAPEAIQQTFFPLPTSEQVAQFGTGVDLSALPTALVEAAAALAPESVVAKFVAEQQRPFTPDPKAAIGVQTDAVPIGVVKQGFPDVVLRPISGTTALPSSDLAKTAIPPSGFPVQPLVRFARALEPTENLPVQEPMAILNPTLNTTESGGSTSLPSFGGPVGTAFTTSPIDPQIRAGIFGDIAKGLLGAASGFLIGGPAGAAIGLGSTFLPRGGGQAGFAPPVPGQFGFPQPQLPIGQQFPTGLLPTPGFTGLGATPAFQLPQNLQFLANQALGGLGTPPFAGGGGDFRGGGAGGSFGAAALPSIQFPTNGGLAATGLPIAPVIQAQSSLCFRAPKGYVVVEIVGSNGVPVKVAMWRPLAISLKLFKRRPRPLLSAADGKAIRRAERVEKKLKRLASRAGLVCRTKGRRAAPRTSHRK